jgi:hypothetical protein
MHIFLCCSCLLLVWYGIFCQFQSLLHFVRLITCLGSSRFILPKYLLYVCFPLLHFVRLITRLGSSRFTLTKSLLYVCFPLLHFVRLITCLESFGFIYPNLYYIFVFLPSFQYLCLFPFGNAIEITRVASFLCLWFYYAYGFLL